MVDILDTDVQSINQSLITKGPDGIDDIDVYYLQSIAATDLKGGGSFNFSFFCISFLNLVVKL